MVTVPEGMYTALLNEYAAEGWELQTVAHDVRMTPERQEGGRLPVPPGLGVLGQAASKLDELGSRESSEPAPGTITTRIHWVLRRLVEAD